MHSHVAILDHRALLRPPPAIALPFALSVHPGPFFLVVATGAGELADVLSAVDLMAAVAGCNGQARALLDLMAVEIELSPVEHLALRTHMADALQRFERVASVVPARYPVEGGEMGVPVGGPNVRTFRSLTDAIDWVQDYREL